MGDISDRLTGEAGCENRGGMPAREDRSSTMVGQEHRRACSVERSSEVRGRILG